METMHESEIREALKHLNTMAAITPDGALEIPEDMTIREFTEVMESAADAYVNRFIGEGICPKCVHSIVIEQLEYLEIDPHPLLVALSASWALVGAHLANNRVES